MDQPLTDKPKPGRIATLTAGATSPRLDTFKQSPPPFYFNNFVETNPAGRDRVATADDSPATLDPQGNDILITRTQPDRQLQSVDVTADLTMFLGCTVGANPTFRTLSTLDWVVRFKGTFNPGPPPTFTPAADAGITAQPSVSGGGTPVQVAPIVKDALIFVDGPAI